MAYKDLREFLKACKEDGDLLEIDRHVSLNPDIGKILRKANAKQGGPVLVFNNSDSPYPIVSGVFSNRAKALRAFNASSQNILARFIDGLHNPINPVIVETAPCQEVVITGDDIDITKLPIPKFSTLDGGPYLTAGITVSRDPQTGANDIGHYRYQVHDKNTFGWFAQPFHRFGKHCIKARALGWSKYQAAIVIGTDPVIGYACQLKNVAEDVDDWPLAGGLRGEAVELVQCKTIDLQVPADAEFVIEIEVDFTTERPEGPLGEYSGYFTDASNKPVCRVKAITHRRCPLFQVLLAGKPVGEVHMLKNIPFEASFLNTLQQQFPTISAVSIRPSGGVQLFVVLAIKQRYAGEARQAIINVMSSNIRPKWVIAVDPDIDVYDSADVEWAMSFRTVPGRDVFIINNVPSAPLDPSSTNPEDTKNRLNSTVGIDATEPFDGSYPAVADVPGWQDYRFPELDKL